VDYGVMALQGALLIPAFDISLDRYQNYI
jgi:hypothetical protein